MAKTGLAGFVLALLIALPGAAQQTSSDEAKQKGRLEGHVRSHGTPLVGASVRLRKVVEGFGGPPDPNESAYSVQTGPGGLYVFEGVGPASYRIYADQPGYVRRFYGARSVTTLSPGTVVQLVAGQTLKNLDVELIPQGSISGRVKDENDEPVREGLATALRIWYEDGHRELLPMGSADTDVDGGFAVRSLPPGTYYICVEQKTPPRIAGAAGSRQQREALEQMLRRTFYPDADGPEAAAPVTVPAGVAIQGINFHMKRANLLHVRGKVDWGAVGTTAKPLVLALAPAAFDLLGTVNPRLAHVRTDGSFAFDEVVAGTYYIGPARVGVDASVQELGGTTAVEVRDEDVSDVTLRLLRAPDLAGRIRIEAASPNGAGPSIAAVGLRPPEDGTTSTGVPGLGANLPKPAGGVAGAAVPPPPGYQEGSPTQQSEGSIPGATGEASGVGPPAVAPLVATATAPVTSGLSLAEIGIRLIAAERVSLNLPDTTAGLDGSFRLLAVPPDRYLVQTANLPDGTYVKTISFNGQQLTNSVLDLTSGSNGELNILLSKEAGEVSGTVLDSDGNAQQAAWVSLWPTDRNSSETAEVAITDGRGAFRLGHLAPGKYRAVAWEEIEYGLAQTAAFCRLFDQDGTSIDLDEGSRESVRLKPVPSGRIEEATWRLPR
jgi:hypothetical protein